MTTSRLLVLGAGGHGRAVADVAVECGWTVVGFTDPARERPGVVGDDGTVRDFVRAGTIDGAVVGVGSVALARRVELFRLLKAEGAPAPTLVHPRATVSRSCRIGEGAVVFAGSVLGAGVRIGDNAVVYSGALVEHDCRLADHVYLGPGVVLSGSIAVERRAFLGSGAVVLPGVTIGEAAVVAAGAVVTRDVAAGETVVGTPARAVVQRA
jgi:sugar O-acyltransferase (sialic acid O-acetyltransferase NeuD family)